MAERDPEQTGDVPEKGDDVNVTDDDDEPVDDDPRADRVDEQELDSFPASDPHSDWSGPPS